MASITKRGKYWRAQIIRRGYPPQFRTFDTKIEAEGWTRLIENEMDRGIFITRSESERTTLSEALERYWSEVAIHKRHPQQERRRLNHWQRQPLAHCFLANLRGSDFARYRDERRCQGKAENTIRLELAIVSHLFETARKEWGMESLLNPLKNIRKPSGSLERDRRLKRGEYEMLSDELAKCGNSWIKPMFDFAIETALRQGMLFVLRWEWVKLEQKVIVVPQQFRGSGNKAVPCVIPLSKKAVDVLVNLPKSIDGRLFPHRRWKLFG